MAKLSDQFAQQEADQQQGVKTRKERVAEQQQLKRNELARQRFENLRSQAQVIQDTKFVDRVDQETYQEEVVDWSKVSGRSGWWRGANSRIRAKYLKIYKSQGKTKIVTKTRDKVVKFTLEDVEGTDDNSYFDIYDNLSPELKQFFDTPDVVLENKATRIKTTKETILQKRLDADQRIADLKLKYQKKISDREAWFSRKSSKYRHDRKNKDRQNKRIDGYEDKLEERIAELQGYKKGLSKGEAQLNSNKDVAIGDIESYAWDLGNYEQRREEARNERSQFKRDQKLEVRRLEEAGYSAQVIEKSFKGNPTSVALSFYNQKTGDWKQVAEVKTSGKIDVAGFDKLGYSDRQDRSFNFGGKDFKFKSSVGIFKNKKGVVVTPYASTGFTEAQLIKQQQDVAYDDYVKERSTRDIYSNPIPKPVAHTVGGTTYIPTTDFAGYVDQGTKSTQPTFVSVPVDRDYEKFDGSSFVADLYKKIPQGEFVITPLGLSAGRGSADWQKKYEFSVTDLIGKGRDFLQEKSDAVSFKLSKHDKVAPILDELNTKYTDENQLRYEDVVAKDLIYGNITEDQAKTKYLESDSYKILTEKYGEDYAKTIKSATSRKNLGALDFAVATGKYGSQKFAYGLGDFALGRVETPKKFVETTAVVGGAVVTYGAVTGISPAVAQAVNVAVLTGGAGYGAYEVFKPDATPTSAFGGAVLLGTSLAFAGYGAYKHLKAPHVTRVKIKPPKMDLKATGTIGKDVKVIQDGVTKANKVVYNSQKLSQKGFAGSRSVVTTKWKHYLNSFNKKFNYKIKAEIGRGHGINTRVKLDLLKPSKTPKFANIYEGVPTQQLGKSYSVTSLRGSTKVVIQKSGYAKATDLLKKYGLSDAQAKATLRYTAPRVYETYLNKGVITVKGARATGDFEYLIKRPVIDVNKNLGIKTRGGSTLKEITHVERQLFKDASTKQIYSRYTNTRASGFVDKAGRFKDWKEVEFSAGKTFAKISETQKGFEHVGRVKGFDVYKPDALYKDLISVSKKNALKLKISKTRSAYDIDINFDPTKATLQKTRLYDRIIDLDKGKNVWVKPTNIKKTAWPKYDLNPIKNKPTVYAQPKQTKIINDIMKKIDKVDDFKATGGSQSKYYGGRGGGSSGINVGDPQSLYDGTGRVRQLVITHSGEENIGRYTLQNQIMKMDHLNINHLTQNEIFKTQHLLKLNVNAPTIKVNAINKVLVNQNLNYLINAKMGLYATINAGHLMKQNLLWKQDLKVNMNVDFLVKQNLNYNVKQPIALKTSPALKSQLKTILDLSPTLQPIGANPVYRPPKIPTFKIPIPKPIILPYLKAKISKKSQKNGAGGYNQEAYLPDFTSRALGLKAQTLTEKQAKKKLKQLMTGLEIRRSVKVKF